LTSFTVLAVEAAILPPPPPGDERDTGDVKWWPLRLLGARVLSRAAWVSERKYIGDGFGSGASDGDRTVASA
jgi:hypothetical protein